MVDAAAFDHQDIAVFVLRQARDGGAGHVGDMGLARRVGFTVEFVLHVGRLEQAEQFDAGGEVGRLEAGLVEDELVVRRLGGPFFRQVAAVGAVAGLAVIFRVRCFLGEEFRAAAAEEDVEAAFRPFDQLAGDVLAGVRGGALHVTVGFPVAQRHLGVGGGGRRVGDAGGRDEAGREACAGGELEQRVNFRTRNTGAVAIADAAVHPEHAREGLDAADHGDGGAGRVGDLEIVAVGFRQRRIRQVVHRQVVALAVFAGGLAGIDAGRSDGGDAHAVADEQDDVLRRFCPARRDAGVHGSGGAGVVAVGGLFRQGGFAVRDELRICLRRRGFRRGRAGGEDG